MYFIIIITIITLCKIFFNNYNRIPINITDIVIDRILRMRHRLTFVMRIRRISRNWTKTPLVQNRERSQPQVIQWLSPMSFSAADYVTGRPYNAHRPHRSRRTWSSATRYSRLAASGSGFQTSPWDILSIRSWDIKDGGASRLAIAR